MFELLFREPLTVWRSAEWLFESGWSAAALGAAIALAALVLAVSLWRAPLSAPRKFVIGSLQLLVAATALLMLWQPALEVEKSRDGENTIAWLVDHSRSMETADVDGRTRRDAVIDALGTDGLLSGSAFASRVIAMGDSPRSLGRDGGQGVEGADVLEQLPPPSARSGIVAALEAELGNVSDTSLAAVVVVSDGADNIGTVDAAFWRRLSAAGVPVHTVGAGQSTELVDLELADVRLPDRAFVDSAVTARLRILHPPLGELAVTSQATSEATSANGAESAPPSASVVRLRVSNGDALVLAEDITLTPGMSETVHDVTLDAGEAGLKRLDFVLSGELQEASDVNNRQSRVLDVHSTPRRVLYVEGEPRWEYKFLRRALHDSVGLEVVSLLRTSPNKFYRQGVRDGRELSDGFPRTREALFAYEAVIIGSLSAAELDADQQAALRDFVNVRGGSLLMLAGRQGLADGGWARSGVAAALPVSLDARVGSETYRRQRSKVLPTRQGLRVPWLRLAVDDDANLNAWQSLPDVADTQALGTMKPGARVLLDDGDGNAVLVAQRYGRGVSLVFGTSGTWRWQMGLPSDDDRHERVWQGLLGDMVGQSRPRVSVATPAAIYRDADATPVAVDVLNPDFTPLIDATLQATVVAPDGSRRTLELFGDSATPGRFTGEVALPEDGPWGISVATPPQGEAAVGPAASATRWLLRESEVAEAFGARQQQAFLERVAQATGGRYLDLADIGSLPSAIAAENVALKRSEKLPVWNLPFFFLLLLLGKLAEWSLRLRWKRL